MSTFPCQKGETSTRHIEKTRGILRDCATATEVLQKDVSHIAIIPLLITYFKEDLDLCYRLVDKEITIAELHDIVSDPTPVLIVKGHSLYDPIASCSNLIDQNECVYSSNPFQGILLVFLAYFVFSLDYPIGLKCSLEFIQRISVNIYTVDGRKRVKRFKQQATSFDMRVKTLSDSLEKFRRNMERTRSR